MNRPTNSLGFVLIVLINVEQEQGTTNVRVAGPLRTGPCAGCLRYAAMI